MTDGPENDVRADSDPVAELFGEALDHLALAMSMEAERGAFPRTAVAIVKAVSTGRPGLLFPPFRDVATGSEPAEPAEGDSWLVELDAALDRQMSTPPRIGHRRR